MADGVLVTHTITGVTLYFMIFDGAGSVFNTLTSAFEVFSAGSRSNYVLPLTEVTGERVYTGTIPQILHDEGQYFMVAFEQAGGSPALGDMPVGAADQYDTLKAAADAGAANNAAVLAAIAGLNDPAATAIATAVLAVVVDGSLDVKGVLSRLLAETSKFVVTSTNPLTLEFRKQDGSTKSHTKAFANDSSGMDPV